MICWLQSKAKGQKFLELDKKGQSELRRKKRCIEGVGGESSWEKMDDEYKYLEEIAIFLYVSESRPWIT